MTLALRWLLIYYHFILQQFLIYYGSSFTRTLDLLCLVFYQSFGFTWIVFYQNFGFTVPRVLPELWIYCESGFTVLVIYKDNLLTQKLSDLQQCFEVVNKLIYMFFFSIKTAHQSDFVSCLIPSIKMVFLLQGFNNMFR